MKIISLRLKLNDLGEIVILVCSEIVIPLTLKTNAELAPVILFLKVKLAGTSVIAPRIIVFGGVVCKVKPIAP